MKERTEGKKRNRMTENKGSGESDSEKEGMDGGQNNTGSSAVERGDGGAEEGRVTFTVRADQFPVPSIIDVTSAVVCYLSGLTDRNTIPTGTQAHTHIMQAHAQSKRFQHILDLL